MQYGVSIFWGMERAQCQAILTKVASFSQLEPLPEEKVERDDFSVRYAHVATSAIANDNITIPWSYSDSWEVKLAISHALAQSTKLCLYEAAMQQLVIATKDMPNLLSRTGKV